MKRKWLMFAAMCLMFFALLFGESPQKEKPKPQTPAENPLSAFTQAMMDRLPANLKVKQVVGEPLKVGKLTIIPVIMIDFGYGGGGGGPTPQAGGQGYYMGGEARPLGFIVISKSGTQFVSVGKIPRN